MSGAGVLIITRGKDREKQIILGKEEKGNYSAFGGTKNANETLAECAARETKEESKGLFDFSAADLAKCPTIDMNGRLCYLVYVDNTIGFCSKFKTIKATHAHSNEMSELVRVPVRAVRGVWKQTKRVPDKVMSEANAAHVKGRVIELRKITQIIMAKAFAAKLL
jgi:hypothetical protein